MKSGFNDPIAQKPKEHKKHSPWNFQQPQYDERTSCFVDAGTNYGIGYKCPVGREGNAKMRADTLPFGRPNTMQTDRPSIRKNEAVFEE